MHVSAKPRNPPTKEALGHTHKDEASNKAPACIHVLFSSRNGQEGQTRGSAHLRG